MSTTIDYCILLTARTVGAFYDGLKRHFDFCADPSNTAWPRAILHIHVPVFLTSSLELVWTLNAPALGLLSHDQLPWLHLAVMLNLFLCALHPIAIPLFYVPRDYSAERHPRLTAACLGFSFVWVVAMHAASIVLTWRFA